MDAKIEHSQCLVQSDPIPSGRHEVFLDGVGQTRALVRAPHTLWRDVHQRRVETLPHLQERGRTLTPLAPRDFGEVSGERSPPHLQAEGRHHGLVVADSVAHDAGVFVLRDQERILVRPIIGRGRCRLAVLLVLWRRSFGFDAPQDSVRPGRFSFLPTERNEKLGCVLHSGKKTKNQNAGTSKTEADERELCT